MLSSSAGPAIGVMSGRCVKVKWDSWMGESGKESGKAPSMFLSWVGGVFFNASACSRKDGGSGEDASLGEGGGGVRRAVPLPDATGMF
jgi:hypothetical protein